MTPALLTCAPCVPQRENRSTAEMTISRLDADRLAACTSHCTRQIFYQLHPQSNQAEFPDTRIDFEEQRALTRLVQHEPLRLSNTEGA